MIDDQYQECCTLCGTPLVDNTSPIYQKHAIYSDPLICPTCFQTWLPEHDEKEQVRKRRAQAQRRRVR